MVVKEWMIFFCVIVMTAGCATPGTQQIQKKCKSVDNMTDTFVCEQP